MRPHMDSRVTMRMIAEAAGVHISTVSRALAAKRRNRPLSDKEERVLRTAEEMGYVPNPNAASLTTRRSTAFGVLVPQLADTVLATVYDAIELSANQAGYDTFVANTHDDPAEQLRRLSLLRGRSVDGLILGDAWVDGTNLPTLAKTGPPFVLVSRTSGDFLSVSADDYQGGWLVGRHLASLGHERIAVVGGSTWASTAIDRTQGCVDAVRDAGGDVPAGAIVPSGGFGVEDGYEATEKLLSEGQAPTAVFALNDMAALGAMSCLKKHGRSIGSDVAVVGYNDVALASHLPVPLTTVRSPLKQMGEQAVALLLALLEGREPQSIRLETELIIRASTSGVVG